MFVLIIVIHYYMVCLITVSIDCKKNKNEQRCAYSNIKRLIETCQYIYF